jgi:mannose-6-phosphate isomerase-like protein (cupin superfamily)
VAHRTVDEIWFVVKGQGRIWRRAGGNEEITALLPGMSLTLPVGTEFQFRNDGAGPLDILGVTMPPWPGEDEAKAASGTWAPSVTL